MGEGYGRTKIEKNHGHCADVLMSDYGIPRKRRVELCHKIAEVWVEDTMFHDLVIASVRGYYPNRNIGPLVGYLETYKTHEPKNHKREF